MAMRRRVSVVGWVAGVLACAIVIGAYGLAWNRPLAWGVDRWDLVFVVGRGNVYIYRVNANRMFPVTATELAQIARDYSDTYSEVCQLRWRPEAAAGIVIIPMAIPLGVLVTVGVCCWWYGRRKPAGVCRGCGYDVTGNVSGRCPECGRAIGAKGRQK